ncbi:hypothetical protein ACFE04_003998 [Oxalis oulophora]
MISLISKTKLYTKLKINRNSQYHSLASIIQNPNSNSSHQTSSYYVSLLQSCLTRKCLNPGKQLHARLFQLGFGYNTYTATKLVNLYCVCNSLRDAHRLFDKISKRNLFLWNVMIRGYAWNGPYEMAVKLYYLMINDYRLVPDKFTFPFVLKACSVLCDVDHGREIHEHVTRIGCETDVFVGAALVDMYAKCSCVGSARQVFDKIVGKDIVVWNSMLGAYTQNGLPDEALDLGRELALSVNLRPSEGTLVILISAAADIASLPRGREIHAASWRFGLGMNDKVKTSLVDMYSKCGFVKMARILFDRLLEKRLVSWNSMITGYAMHGHSSEALNLFENMKNVCQPDHITFVGVLSACSHGGLLDKGRMFFELMVEDYRIDPTVQHCTCMVDLLGHSGRLDEAYNFIMQMKVFPDSGIWGALLNSCKTHGNVELGELALEKLLELKPDDAGNYVILSNIYAEAGKWEGVANLRKLMTDRGLRKETACSWIEVKNRVHAFLSGDTSHPEFANIQNELKVLEGRMREAGYVPSTKSVFHDVEDDEKANMVCFHSERLAIAFGLISTPVKSRLLITKNIKICEDCHVAIKFISQVTEREIIIRDVNRYHHFKDGMCSCGDYW